MHTFLILRNQVSTPHKTVRKIVLFFIIFGFFKHTQAYVETEFSKY